MAASDKVFREMNVALVLNMVIEVHDLTPHYLLSTGHCLSNDPARGYTEAALARSQRLLQALVARPEILRRVMLKEALRIAAMELEIDPFGPDPGRRFAATDITDQELLEPVLPDLSPEDCTYWETAIRRSVVYGKDGQSYYRSLDADELDLVLDAIAVTSTSLALCPQGEPPIEGDLHNESNDEEEEE